MTRLTKEQLESLWAEHLAGEFTTRDVEATLATMIDSASVNHVPVNTGGKGKDELRAFYRDVFIPSWPDDLIMTPLNRVVGDSQLVDELHLSFSHSKKMDWFLPGVPPTNRKIDIDMVVIVMFEGDKLATERIYWDQATVLRQIGME
jgi:carboxymethylenebutenolidase